MPENAGRGTAMQQPCRAKCVADGMQGGALLRELNPPVEFGRSWLVIFKGRKDFKNVEMLPFGKAEFLKTIFRLKPSVCPFWSSSCSGMRHRKELPKQRCNSARAEELGTGQGRAAGLAARCCARSPAPCRDWPWLQPAIHLGAEVIANSENLHFVLMQNELFPSSLFSS